jgi:two-component system, response regulator / RNA-binding antiterminator
MPFMQNIILFTNHSDKAAAIGQSLTNLGETVYKLDLNQLHTFSLGLQLADVCIAVEDKVDDALLNKIGKLVAQLQVPVMIFTEDNQAEHIVAATNVGMSAYIAGEIDMARLPSLIAAAKARFELTRKLVEELDDTKGKLGERKIIERAKGLLMKQRQLDEDTAYTLMREMAMKKNMKIVELSQQLLNAADMLTI